MSAHPAAAAAATTTTPPADDATPLTALCGVCHVSAPKYRCPRCAARTCSLACVTRHKSRAGCSGARDPAAFVPASRLRTPAGIDHDYNFLSAIERARDRAARDVAGRTGIAPPVNAPDELPPDQANGGGNHNRRGGGRGGGRGGRGGGGGAALGAKEQQVRFRKIWRGDELIHVPIDPASWGRQRQQMDHMGDYRQAGAELMGELHKEEEDEDEEMPDAAAAVAALPRQHPEQEYERISWFPQVMGKAEKARCRDLDIEVIAAPTGLARQRENRIMWNKRGKGIKWTVEWLVYDLVDKEELGDAESDADSDTSSSGSESESEPGRGTTTRLGSDRKKTLSAKPTRIVHTASDTEPLFRCFANTINWVRRGQEKEKAAAAQQQQKALGLIEDAADADGGDDANLSQMKKKRKKARLEARAGQQDGSGGGTWPASAYTAQNPFTGCWETEELGAATSCNGWEADEDLDRRRKGFRYYLLRPATGPPPRRLIPIQPDGTLAEALQGRTVLEYPTIYVIPVDLDASSSGSLLPRGHAEASAGDRRPPRPPPVRQEPEQEVANGRGWGKNVARRGGREQSGGRAGMMTGRGGQQGSNNNPRDRKRKPSEQHRQQRGPEKKIKVDSPDEGAAAAMEDGEMGDGGGAALAAVAAAAALDQAVDARVVRAALLKVEETQGAAPGGLVAYDSDSE
ncbi:hypothetical protein RB595_004129 [Gaeumannomyces hyphopodioides]